MRTARAARGNRVAWALALAAFVTCGGAAEVDASCPAEPCEDCSAGFIANGSMSCGDCWETIGPASFQANKFEITVTTAGAASNAQVLQRRLCSYDLDENTVYTLRFKGWATSAGKSVVVQLAVKDEDGADPDSFPDWVALVDAAEFVLNTASGEQWHEATFRMPDLPTWLGGNRMVELSFNYGHNTGTFYLDDVTLTTTATLALGGSTITPFDFSTDEAWFEGAAGAAAIDAHQGASGKLAVAVAANQARFLYRYQPLDLPFTGYGSLAPDDPAPDAPWLMKLSVSVTNPQNLGRIYVTGLSASGQYLVASRGGLHAGANVVDLRPLDFFRYPEVQHFCWGDGDDPCDPGDGPYVVGVRVEANGNGSATVELDELEVVPDSSGSLRAGAGPVLSYVNVVPGTTSATFTWTTSETVARADSGVRCGTSPTSYGSSVRESGSGSTTSHTVTVPSLTADTAYHCIVLADADDTAGDDAGEGRSPDVAFRTEPVQPWTAPDPTATVPFGVTIAPSGADVDIAADAGFDRVQSFVYGGCGLSCDPEVMDHDQQYTDAATALLDRAEDRDVTVLLTAFCSACLLMEDPDQSLPDPGSGCSTCPSGDDGWLCEHVKDRVAFLRGFGSLGGYYLADEPPYDGEESPAEPDPLWEERLGYVFDRIDTCDDTSHATLRPVTIGVAGGVGLGFPDDYPYLGQLDRANGGFYPFGAGDDFGDFVDQVEEAVDTAASEGKVFDLAVQAYQKDIINGHWPSEFQEPTAYPTRAEMERIVYTGLALGVDGLWAYAGTAILAFPGTDWVWANLASVLRDVRRLEPALVDGTDVSCISVTPSSGEAESVLARSYRNRVYVVSRHGGSGSGNVTYTQSSGCTGTAQALGGSGAPTGVSGGFTVAFSPGIHLHKVFTSVSPDVLITSPANGSSAEACTSVTVTAYADDDGGVTKVQFKRGGILMSEDTTAPYAASIEMDGGSNTIQAVAWDASSNTTSHSITVTGTGLPPNTFCP